MKIHILNGKGAAEALASAERKDQYNKKCHERKYREYELSRYYSHNPMERQAKRNEDKYTKICLKDIKKRL